MGDDRSEVVQPMHSLDVDPEVWREVPRRTEYAISSPGAIAAPSVVDVHPIRCRRRKLVPVDRGVALAMTDHVCAWAAASPARYRASSSAMAASKSSRSNMTTAAIRSSASISTT